MHNGDMWGWVGGDKRDRSDTAMSRILRVTFAVIAIFIVAAGLVMYATAAEADGVTVYAGEDLRVRCAMPATYTDGTPIAGPLTIRFYATQTPPTIGEPLGTFNACDGTASTRGMAAGQWHLYATATQDGRPVSALSPSTPFWLAPALDVAPGTPTDLVVERIPASPR